MTSNLTQIIRGQTQGHEFILEMATETILRLRVAAGEKLEPEVSYSIATDALLGASFTTRKEAGVTAIKSAMLEIEIAADPLHLRIRDKNGNIRFETAAEALRFEGDSVSLLRRMPANERVYGFGETGAKFEKSGRSYTFWNTDDPAHHPLQNYYCQIPFSLHLTPDEVPPHALFVDNTGKCEVDLGRREPGIARFRAEKGGLCVWLFFADSLRELLSLWADLTGYIERPPLWAIGYHQCRWSYYPEERLRELAAEFRRRRIPCDALYLDIDYMDGYRVFTWDSIGFPDPSTLLSDLRADGFRTVAIVDPGVMVDEEYEVFREFSSREGFFCSLPSGEPFRGRVWPGDVHFPDFTREDVRRAWGQFQKTALLDHGIAGIWNDMNEPAVFGAGTFPPDVVQEDFGLRRPHDRIHQIYGLTMARASWEGLTAARPHERSFAITRSGFAGVQRYSMVWTGDNVSAWPSMEFDIQLNLNMGLTGIPFTGCDIGGFSADCDEELFARWIEWGVFQPFCRVHSAIGTLDQEPWSFGTAVEKIARQLIELRMRLLPYLYTCFVEAAENAAPVNRPLVLDFGNDATVHTIGDQFLLGGDFLIAPVLKPGANRRMVYLPAGEWHDFWSQERLEGGRWLIVEAPLGQPPVFVRAGAVVPMGPVRQHVRDGLFDHTFLDIYPGHVLEGAFVEDDGETQAWRNGEESRWKFSGFENNLGLKLFLSAPEGDFRSPRERWVFRLHRTSGTVRSITCAGKPVTFEHNGAVVQWTIPDNHAALEIAVSYGA